MRFQNKHPVQTGATDPENMTTVAESIRSLVQLLRVAGRESQQELGISSAQLNILRELQDGPALSINQLADRTYTHQSSVSIVVAKLVGNRLVTRSSSEGDARKVAISLAPGGRALLRKSARAREDKLTAALGRMRRTDLKELGRHLETLTNLLSENPEEKRSISLEA